MQNKLVTIHSIPKGDKEYKIINLMVGYIREALSFVDRSIEARRQRLHRNMPQTRSWCVKDTSAKTSGKLTLVTIKRVCDVGKGSLASVVAGANNFDIAKRDGHVLSTREEGGAENLSMVEELGRRRSLRSNKSGIFSTKSGLGSL